MGVSRRFFKFFRAIFARPLATDSPLPLRNKEYPIALLIGEAGVGKT